MHKRKVEEIYNKLQNNLDCSIINIYGEMDKKIHHFQQTATPEANFVLFLVEVQYLGFFPLKNVVSSSFWRKK